MTVAEAASVSLADRVAALEAEVGELVTRVEGIAGHDGMSIFVISGELERVHASLLLATSAAAMGMNVHMFFTFWGTSALKKRRSGRTRNKSFLQRMFGWFMPRGSRKMAMARFNFFGLGPIFLRYMLRRHKSPDVDALLDIAVETGVHFHVCSMSMEVMGIQREELRDIPNLDYIGLAKFVGLADGGRHTLFV
jgi:peroxiredoxin family protein